MHETSPRAFLIARPSLNWEGIQAYLDLVGGQAHYEKMRLNPDEQHGSLLTEFAGRACYRSWDIGLNPNVTRIRTDRNQYLANILNTGHGSVLEHANYSFVLANVSRVFTHELVRHRAGWAFSQESMRYVRLDDIGFQHPEIFPDSVDGDALYEQAQQLLEDMENFQIDAARVHNLDDPDKPFSEKKAITSAMRRYAPDGLSTTIVFTANVRALRWVTQLRTDPAAEVEIRYVMDQVAEIMLKEEPALFQDFEVDDDGAWRPANRKV
jgi:thymidylate synthase (FAD)